MARSPFTDRIVSIAANVARDVARSFLRSITNSRTGTSGRGTVAHSTTKNTTGASTRDSHGTSDSRGKDRSTTIKPRPSGGAPLTTQAYYRDRDLPLPAFSYHPRPNDEPDPGEVVWTWVPYEEDNSQGKDRPVLVLAYEGKTVVAAQMTSQNHHLDAAQEAHWGRYWMDIGSGDWDRQGRASQVRLDRLLVVPAHAMRREGGRLDEATFQRVCTAIKKTQN